MASLFVPDRLGILESPGTERSIEKDRETKASHNMSNLDGLLKHKITYRKLSPQNVQDHPNWTVKHTTWSFSYLTGQSVCMNAIIKFLFRTV